MKNKNPFCVWNRNHKIYEFDQNQKKRKPEKLRAILKCLRYAKRSDKVVLASGILSAVALGFLAPLNAYLFLTPPLEIFIKAETPGNPYNVNITSEIHKFQEFGYGYIIIGIITLTLSTIQIIASEIASRNIMARIKTAYLSKMLSIEAGWYDKSQEQFVNIVSHDLHKMKALFDGEMTNAVDMVSFFFFGFGAGLMASWKVALLSLGTMSIAIFVMYFILQTSKKKGNLRQEYVRQCTKVTSEVLGNTRTVAAYGGEYKEIERFKSTLKMVNRYGLKYSTVISFGKAFNYFQLCICYMVAYYFAMRLFILDDFEPSLIAIILTIQINAVFNCSYLLNTLYELNMARDSAYRVMAFLDAETSYGKSLEMGVEPETFKAEVSFKNVQFSYPTSIHTKVLHDLTLDVELGKVTAVVGTSGTGKSTVVGLISRLYDATAGEILIGGVDIQKLNISWLRNQIGIVGQEPTLFDTSIQENIRYGKTDATMEEIIEAAKISFAHGFIEKLPAGYDSIVGERGTKMSEGQKQRIAIARAIVKKPKLLILDEATSALDFHSEVIVHEALDNAMLGRTSLIIAHRMSTVKNADIIYAMKDGRVLEKGSHGELMELKGYYYSLAKAQELEEKDRAFTINKKKLSIDESIDEIIPMAQDDLEIPENKKLSWLSKKNFKIMVLWFLAILFTTITSSFLPIFHYIFSLLCQSFTYNKDELNAIALIDISYLFGLATIIFFAVLMTGVMSTIVTQLWLKKLQKRAFEKIVSMDISWFDWSGNSPNECLEVLTNSPPMIESVTGERGAQVAIFMLSMLFSLGYSFIVSVSVTLANLPIFLIFFVINCLRLRTRDADVRSAALMTKATKVATEYVQHVKTIQILNCQKYVINLYEDLLLLSKKEASVSTIWYAAVYGFSKTLIRWSLAVLFIYGIDVIARGEAEGTLLIGVVFTLSIAATLSGIILVLTSQYPAARQALNQLSRIANTKKSFNTLSDEGKKPEISGNIVFQDVAFAYPTRPKAQILKKLNLKIEAGKTVALVGNSGCGKSTIISLIERFYLPNGGKILIDGNDINDINVRYLRSQMGLVSQEPVLFDMTIKENILYGLEEEVSMERIIEAAKIANIHNFIMKLPQAYDTSVGERGSKLSAGQKQRIAIARAVLRKPKILLLDEATSALDTENEKAVQEALENASVGRTNIVIAHRLSTIRKADKIVVLQSGRVVEEGNHQQLVEKRGHYYNLLNR